MISSVGLSFSWTYLYSQRPLFRSHEMKWWHWNLRQGYPEESQEVWLASVQVLC